MTKLILNLEKDEEKILLSRAKELKVTPTKYIRELLFGDSENKLLRLKELERAPNLLRVVEGEKQESKNWIA